LLKRLLLHHNTSETLYTMILKAKFFICSSVKVFQDN